MPGAESEDGGSDPLAAIRAVNSSATPDGTAILVLKNFHRFIQSAEIVQALAQQILAFKQNLRQTFFKILKAAGVVPWPKLFQNLRASRETELMARIPRADVSSWLGNTETVAMRHYEMEMQVSFQVASDPAGTTITGARASSKKRLLVVLVVTMVDPFRDILALLHRKPRKQKPPFRTAKQGFL